MISIGFDPGRNWGWSVYFDSALRKTMYPDYKHPADSKKFSTLQGFYKEVGEILDEWKPDVVVTCRAMGSFSNIIRIHGAMSGVVELCCEERHTPYMDIEDSTMRKAILGKGNLKKDQVMEALGIPNEHTADAHVAAMYGIKSVIPEFFNDDQEERNQ